MPLNCQCSALKIKYEDALIQRALTVLEGRLGNASKELIDINNAKNFAKLKFSQLEHEEFGCMFLTVHYELVEYHRASIGTLGECAVYPREIVKAALKANAAFVILMHNHPCGSLEASHYDIKLTHNLQCCLELVDVIVWDHLIVAGTEVYSMRDNGQMLQP